MPYDISIKKVALAGASGKIGTTVLKELLKSELFEITVLTRESSTHNFPSGVAVKKVDYTDLESLSTALKGQDALISTVALKAVPSQRLLIDAAVKAGVKRVIPSEFGADLKNAKSRALPCFAGKVEIEKYLDELAVRGLMSYTLLFTGPFIDMCLREGLFFDFKGRTANLYDGGHQLISMSRLSTAGKAVRRILTHPRETADRAIWVKDIDVSQNQLLKLAQALTPSDKWATKKVSAEGLGKEEDILKAIFFSEYGIKFEHVHNSILGIKGITNPDLEELVASIFGRRESLNQ